MVSESMACYARCHLTLPLSCAAKNPGNPKLANTAPASALVRHLGRDLHSTHSLRRQSRLRSAAFEEQPMRVLARAES